MGGPDPATTDLRARYAEIVRWFEEAGATVTTKDLALSFNFEQCLADLVACKRCSAKRLTVVELECPKGERIQVNRYEDCTTTTGRGWYLDADLEYAKDSGHVGWRMRNCRGPAERKKEILERAGSAKPTALGLREEM